MYGNEAGAYKRLKTNNMRLSAYSGHEIQCQYKYSKWISAKFNVVDVPGPAVIGLPTSELLNLVTVHVDIIKGIMHDDKKDKPQQKMLKITSCEDLKRTYPNQFDKIGNFKGPAKLIDPPWKCSIHIKDKLKEELNKLVEQDVLQNVATYTILRRMDPYGYV